MNSIEKSKIYAEGKVIEALRQVVADAYMVGYNAGYQDGIDKIAEDSVLEETEFVDLGLPSGTLWASDYVKDGDEVLFLPYPEALKYDIPSEEQVNELGEYCKIIRMNDSAADKFIYMVLGPNGNSVTFEDMDIWTFLRSVVAICRFSGRFIIVIIRRNFMCRISILMES